MGKSKKRELNRKIAIFGGKLVNKSAEGTMGYGLLFRETSEQLTQVGTWGNNCSDRGLSIILTHMQNGAMYQADCAGELYIGRQNVKGFSSFLKIPEADISKTHCHIFEFSGAVYIEDLQSSNHTYVNGTRIVQPVPIMDGYVIRLGRTSYQVMIRK